MSVFKDYAAYYDLLYKDKDYPSECLYIHQLIPQYVSGANSVLNIRCGTGNHDFLLANLGYQVSGIDFSDLQLLLLQCLLLDDGIHLRPVRRTPNHPSVAERVERRHAASRNQSWIRAKKCALGSPERGRYGILPGGYEAMTE